LDFNQSHLQELNYNKQLLHRARLQFLQELVLSMQLWLVAAAVVAAAGTLGLQVQAVVAVERQLLVGHQFQQLASLEQAAVVEQQVLVRPA
jgi:hypothetical protein